jgi:ribosomal protein S18 acetylase RimI-like enzyme
MTYTLRFLSPRDIPALYQTFRLAFADYVQDASHVTETIFTNRAIKNGVDFDASVGVFAGGELVGFTLVGIDYFQGCYAAFDASTGIIKAYRGQGLAKAMFDFILPKLRAEGVEKFYLEVLQENEPAIRAYKKAGFAIHREMDSFKINLDEIHFNDVGVKSISILPIKEPDLEMVADFFDWLPSWENSLSSIRRIPDEVQVLGAFVDGTLVGCLVYYPTLNWILSLAVHPSHRRHQIGSAMLSYLNMQIASNVRVTKIINVDHADDGMISFLQNVGFRFAFNQFEMCLAL